MVKKEQLINIAEGLLGHEKDLDLAARFRALSTAFPGIAHDMRGQLNNIVVNLELMKGALERAIQHNSGDFSAEPTRYRDISLRQIRQLDQIIQSLLELLDLEPSPGLPFNLSELLDNVHALIKTHARHRGINLVWPADGQAVMCALPRPMIKRAIFHLFMTLIDELPKKGALRVALTVDAQQAIFAIQMDKRDAATITEDASSISEAAPVSMLNRVLEELGSSGLQARQDEKILSIVFPHITA